MEPLHDRCFGQALEGVLEPVFWQASTSDIRKFPERFQVEILRAYQPTRFNTPGTRKLQLTTGDGAQILIIGEAEQDQLIAMRQQG